MSAGATPDSLDSSATSPLDSCAATRVSRREGSAPTSKCDFSAIVAFPLRFPRRRQHQFRHRPSKYCRRDHPARTGPTGSTKVILVARVTTTNSSWAFNITKNSTSSAKRVWSRRLSVWCLRLSNLTPKPDKSDSVAVRRKASIVGTKTNPLDSASTTRYASTALVVSYSIALQQCLRCE